MIVNSGIANACTGAEGFGYCEDTAKAAAEMLGISIDGVLLGSTIVYETQMPMDKLIAGGILKADHEDRDNEQDT